MMIVEISTLDRVSGDPLDSELYVTESIGKALDKHAPDPGEDARFQVLMVRKEATVIDD